MACEPTEFESYPAEFQPLVDFINDTDDANKLSSADKHGLAPFETQLSWDQYGLPPLETPLSCDENGLPPVEHYSSSGEPPTPYIRGAAIGNDLFLPVMENHSSPNEFCLQPVENQFSSDEFNPPSLQSHLSSGEPFVSYAEGLVLGEAFGLSRLNEADLSPTKEGDLPMVDTLAPVVDISAPVVDTLAPFVDTSAPVVGTSAPVVESPIIPPKVSKRSRVSNTAETETTTKEHVVASLRPDLLWKAVWNMRQLRRWPPGVPAFLFAEPRDCNSGLPVIVMQCLALYIEKPRLASQNRNKTFVQKWAYRLFRDAVRRVNDTISREEKRKLSKEGGNGSGSLATPLVV